MNMLDIMMNLQKAMSSRSTGPIQEIPGGPDTMGIGDILETFRNLRSWLEYMKASSERIEARLAAIDEKLTSVIDGPPIVTPSIHEQALQWAKNDPRLCDPATMNEQLNADDTDPRLQWHAIGKLNGRQTDVNPN